MVRHPAFVGLVVAASLGAGRPPATAPSAVEGQIAAIIRAFKGEMGVCAIDLRGTRVVAVNADARFPTASTIKVAVMVEAYRQAADGRLPLSTTIELRAEDKVGGSGVLDGLHDGLGLTVEDLIHLMIVVSDNTATNMLIGRLGTARVNETLDEYGIRNVRLFRPTFRDGRADVLPELERQFGLGMATPRDMARLMALIGQGKAVSPESSAAMLATLRQQQDRAMIPRLLPDDDVHVANKTGTDEEKRPGPGGRRGHVRADVAVVASPRASYAVAIYARHVEDGRWGVENDALVTGAKISRLIYEYFTGR